MPHLGRSADIYTHWFAHPELYRLHKQDVSNLSFYRIFNRLEQLHHSQVGDKLPKSLTSTTPINVYIRGTEESETAAGGPFNVTTFKYTVLVIDAGPPGNKSTQGFNLHWLANDWSEISFRCNEAISLTYAIH